MLSFYGGGNPFAQNPTQMLSQMAQPDPETTGAIPAPSPQVAAPAPAPGSGGLSLSGIGDKIGDAISGRGLLGGSPTDAEIDPVTGAPKGLGRQANMQSLMKMGLLFLAAGQNQTNDQRAAILSRAPGLVGEGNEQISSFAKSRLEMAKLRMEQQKMLNEQAANDSITKTLGTLTGGAPSAGAQAVQTAQAGNAQVGATIGAPEAAAVPGATPAPILPTGNTVAPGGVPRGPLLSQADALGVLANPTVGGKGQALSNALTAAQGRETLGTPQFDPRTNKFQTPVLNGRGEVVRMQDGGGPAMTTRDIDGERVKGYQLPDGKFFPVEKSAIPEDPAKVEQRKANLELAKGDRETLTKNYQENVQKSVQTYDKMRDIREQVTQGKGVFGTTSDLRRATLNALATAGYLNKDKIEDLNVTSNFERVMKGGVAGAIKDFNGSQGVSNADREFALAVMQASATGNRDAVINALTNGMNDTKSQVQRHNENVDRHNGLLDDFDGSAKKRLTVPRVDRDFDREEADRAPKQADAPAGAVRYERVNGKIVRVK